MLSADHFIGRCHRSPNRTQAACRIASIRLNHSTTWFQPAGIRDARLRSPDTLASFVWASHLQVQLNAGRAASVRAQPQAKSDPDEAEPSNLLCEVGPPRDGLERTASRRDSESHLAIPSAHLRLKVGCSCVLGRSSVGFSAGFREVRRLHFIEHEKPKQQQVHNSSGSQHTAALRPWTLVAFTDSNPESAAAFEEYLKTGSGRAF
jgi:hypothetical protein